MRCLMPRNPPPLPPSPFVLVHRRVQRIAPPYIAAVFLHSLELSALTPPPSFASPRSSRLRDKIPNYSICARISPSTDSPSQAANPPTPRLPPHHRLPEAQQRQRHRLSGTRTRRNPPRTLFRPVAAAAAAALRARQAEQREQEPLRVFRLAPLNAGVSHRSGR